MMVIAWQCNIAKFIYIYLIAMYALIRVGGKKMRKAGIIIGVGLAVFLLLAMGFSGTVYSENINANGDMSLGHIHGVVMKKNTVNDKILAFSVGSDKLRIHYSVMGVGKYAVKIIIIHKDGKVYSSHYSVDRFSHTLYINGRVITIKKISPVKKGIRILNSKSYSGTYTYQYDGYLKYINDGNPYGGPIKYPHPYRQQPYWYDSHYSIGTWETVTLYGERLYHTQIGTDDIGWITELPPELVGAVIGALVGEAIGSIVPLFGNIGGAIIGAIIGVVVGFITGNFVKKHICDETGAGWLWISKKSVNNIIKAHNAFWPWEKFAHIDYFKMGTMGPYSLTIYVQ